MKKVAEFLNEAVHFEEMAAEEIDGPFKQALLEQARTYRKLAKDRATDLRRHPPLPQSD